MIHFIKRASLIAGAIASLTLAIPTLASTEAVQATATATAPLQEPTKQPSWSLRLPETEKVAYRGTVSMDTAGYGSGSMMYPAPNAGGFIAALITHGMINEGIKSSQKAKLEEEADRILQPLQPVLAAYGHKELMQEGWKKVSVNGTKTLVGFSEQHGADWTIQSTPIFYVTQDRTTIILENAVSIYKAGTPKTPAYENTIRIVSDARKNPDLAAFWTSNEGEKLKEESAGLFAHSLDIALDQLANGSKSTGPQKTFRYPEGTTEKIERGQLIGERCDRMVLKTLRGWIMSVPAKSDPATTSKQCSNTVASNAS